MTTVMIPTSSAIQPGNVPYRVRLYYHGELFMVHDTTFKERTLYNASKYTLSHIATGYAMARHNDIDLLVSLCIALRSITPDNFDELVELRMPEYYDLAKTLRTKIRKTLGMKRLQS